MTFEMTSVTRLYDIGMTRVNDIGMTSVIDDENDIKVAISETEPQSI